MMQSIRTIEAIYEHGYLRPLQPIEGREGLVYLVTVIDVSAMNRKRTARSMRGKYRGVMISTTEFARRKQEEILLAEIST
jgi:predicted DNA-binding antitoxin AbrB/MazE fold protein